MKRLTTFKIDPETDCALNELAASTHRSRADVIRGLIRTEAARRRPMSSERQVLTVASPAGVEAVADAGER